MRTQSAREEVLLAWKVVFYFVHASSFAHNKSKNAWLNKWTNAQKLMFRAFLAWEKWLSSLVRSQQSVTTCCSSYTCIIPYLYSLLCHSANILTYLT